MQTVYYISMRKPVAAILGLAIAAGVPAIHARQTRSLSAAIEDSHEGVTVSVDPWTTAGRYKEKFPRKSPYSGGVIALRVRFKNDTDQSIRIDLQRIRLLLVIGEDSRQELTPLTGEQVADTVLLKGGSKDPTVRRNPLPIPTTKPRPSRDKNWTEFRDDCQNAAIPSDVLAAQSSVEGLLYFDLRGQTDLLQSAHLYVPNLTTMSTHQQLLYFDIDLGRSPSR